MINISVLFDEENQQNEIALFKSWKLPYHFNFRAYTIKDDDLNTETINVNDTNLFVILIGESTRFLSCHFVHDVKSIIKSTKAILCLNLNKIIALDEANSPRILWDCGTVNMPFDGGNVSYSLEKIKLDIREKDAKGSFYLRKNPRPYDME